MGNSQTDISSVAWWEDAIVGDSRITLGRTVTESDVIALCALEGSYEPIHCDEEYCKTLPVGRRIAHGLLNLVLAEGMRSHMIWYNGDGFRRQSLIGLVGIDSVRFHVPLYPYDTIRVRTTITDKRESSKPGRGIIIFKDEVINQNDVIVASWERIVLCRKRPQES